MRDIIKYYLQANLNAPECEEESDNFEESEKVDLTKQFDTFARTCNFELTFAFELLTHYFSHLMAQYQKAVAEQIQTQQQAVEEKLEWLVKLANAVLSMSGSTTSSA